MMHETCVGTCPCGSHVPKSRATPGPAMALSPVGLEPGPSNLPLPGRHRNVCIRSSSGRSSRAVSQAQRVGACHVCAAPGQGQEER